MERSKEELRALLQKEIHDLHVRADKIEEQATALRKTANEIEYRTRDLLKD